MSIYRMKERPITIATMTTVVQEAWELIPDLEIRHLVDTIPERVLAVIQLKVDTPDFRTYFTPTPRSGSFLSSTDTGLNLSLSPTLSLPHSFSFPRSLSLSMFRNWIATFVILFICHYLIFCLTYFKPHTALAIGIFRPPGPSQYFTPDPSKHKAW